MNIIITLYVLYDIYIDILYRYIVIRLKESPTNGERNIRYRHVRRIIRLAFTSNRQSGTLM